MREGRINCNVRNVKNVQIGGSYDVYLYGKSAYSKWNSSDLELLYK